METVRLKYVGAEPRLDRTLDIPIVWMPGDVRIYPRRLRPNSKFYKAMKGQIGNDDIGLPIPVFPERISPRDIERSIKWYSLMELVEMREVYQAAKMRQHRDVVDEEIIRREGEGET